MNKKSFTLITGASNGIGKYLALECAKRKNNLVLIALPDTGLSDVSQRLKEDYQVDIHIYEGDLTDVNFIYAIRDDLKSKEITVSILINNAGIGYEGKFEELPVQFCNNLMVLNMQSMVLLTRLFIDNLKQQKKSYVLNVSSMASFTPMPYKSMYAASKSFVYSFSLALRSELRNTSVSVSVLCPGAVPTSQAQIDRIKLHGWFGRLTSVRPEELAAVAIESLLKRRKVIIPGICNKISLLLIKLIPDSLREIILYNSFRRNLIVVRSNVNN